MDSSIDAQVLEASLGRRVREFRRARGLTLQQVAEQSGIAISTLSKIERDQMSPTFDKLLQLSRGLSVDIADLFGREPQAAGASALTPGWDVSRDGKGKVLVTPNYEYSYLCPTMAQKHMIPVVAWVKARSLGEFGPLIRHAGEEFLYVLSGAVEVHLEHAGEPLLLAVGDSAYFDASQGHAFLAVGGRPARILAVLSGDEHLRGQERDKHPDGDTTA